MADALTRYTTGGFGLGGSHGVAKAVMGGGASAARIQVLTRQTMVANAPQPQPIRGQSNSAGSSWGNVNSTRDLAGTTMAGRSCFKCGQEGHISRDFSTAFSDDSPKRDSLLRVVGRDGAHRTSLNAGHGSSGVTCRPYNTTQASFMEALSQRETTQLVPERHRQRSFYLKLLVPVALVAVHHLQPGLHDHCQSLRGDHQRHRFAHHGSNRGLTTGIVPTTGWL
ncbi:hypothetical protein MRX96_019177 [Rhipicephalus microplus]